MLATYIEFWLLEVLRWGTLALAAWAFLDSVTRPNSAFVVAEKLTKPGWMAITAISGVVLYFFGFVSIFGIIAMIATGVYLADVRPAVRSIGRGDNRW